MRPAAPKPVGTVVVRHTGGVSAPETITLHGHDVAFRIAGDGDETLLLIHGMAGSSDTWRRVMPRLAQRYTVIAPDLPGHGRSDAPPGDYSPGALANTLRDLLIGLDAGGVTVVGQSLGGGVAMQFAYQNPDRCNRLVLISSGGLGHTVNPMLRLLTAPGAGFVLGAVTPRFVRDSGNAFRRWLGRRGVHADRADEMWRAFDSLGDAGTRRAFLRTLRGVIDHGGQAVNAVDRLYLTDALPTMVLWGTDDRVIPVGHAEIARAAMPTARVEILDGIGHFPQVEDPDAVIGLLDDFMAATEPASIGPDSYRTHLLRTA